MSEPILLDTVEVKDNFLSIPLLVVEMYNIKNKNTYYIKGINLSYKKYILKNGIKYIAGSNLKLIAYKTEESIKLCFEQQHYGIKESTISTTEATAGIYGLYEAELLLGHKIKLLKGNNVELYCISGFKLV